MKLSEITGFGLEKNYLRIKRYTMNKQLLKAAKKIIMWYDDEDESNPHSTDQWKEAYDELRKAVNNFSSNP